MMPLNGVVAKLYTAPLYVVTTIQALLVSGRNHQLAEVGRDVVFGPTGVISNPSARKAKVVIGAGGEIHGSLKTYPSGGSISLGTECFIGPGARVWSGERIEIGKNVLISHDVEIHDSNSHSLSASARRGEHRLDRSTSLSPRSGVETSPIFIGDDVWIGFRSMIMKGVSIGEGAVIAAGTLVTHDVEPWTLVAGNPMRVVRTLEQASC
jgi:acetyltransferase-like isoleucine patch superfamily enzyme